MSSLQDTDLQESPDDWTSANTPLTFSTTKATAHSFLAELTKAQAGAGGAPKPETKGEEQQKAQEETSLYTLNKPKSNSVAQGKQVAAEKDKDCQCCGQPWHPFKECKKFMAAPVDDRREFLKLAHRCFLCLKKGHMVTSSTEPNPRTH